jgi:hypothetical protein
VEYLPGVPTGMAVVPEGCSDASGLDGAGASGGTGGSGVQGELIVDQGGPVVREDRPWRPYPLRGRIEAVRAGLADMETVAQADSDARGRFRLALPPGAYVLRARNLTGAPVPTAWPVTVHVAAGAFTEVTIHFDSGIR